MDAQLKGCWSTMKGAPLSQPQFPRLGNGRFVEGSFLYCCGILQPALIMPCERYSLIVLSCPFLLAWPLDQPSFTRNQVRGQWCIPVSESGYMCLWEPALRSLPGPLPSPASVVPFEDLSGKGSPQVNQGRAVCLGLCIGKEGPSRTIPPRL